MFLLNENKSSVKYSEFEKSPVSIKVFYYKRSRVHHLEICTRCFGDWESHIFIFVYVVFLTVLYVCHLFRCMCEWSCWNSRYVSDSFSTSDVRVLFKRCLTSVTCWLLHYIRYLVIVSYKTFLSYIHSKCKWGEYYKIVWKFYILCVW